MKVLRARRAPRAVGLQIAVITALIAVPGFATVKAAAVIGYLGYATLTAQTRLPGILVTIGVLGGLIGAWLIGRGSGVPGPLGVDQLSRLAIFFGIFVCASRLQPVFRRAENLDRLCLGSACVAALFKSAILIAVLAFNVPLENLAAALGFETVTQSIGFGLQRLQFPSDFIIAFLVGCYVGGRSRWLDLLFVLAISVVVMLSFSRFIFICFFVAVFVRAFWVRRLDFIARLAVVVAIGTLLVFQDTLVDRFVSEGTETSDEIRTEQIGYLDEQIAIAPWFGHGLGYSVPGYERSETQPYSYEVQWYAFLMQIGTIGCLGLAASVAVTLFRRTRTWRATLSVLVLYLLWAASGLANPYLTSLGTALGFAICTWRAARVDTAGAAT